MFTAAFAVTALLAPTACSGGSGNHAAPPTSISAGASIPVKVNQAVATVSTTPSGQGGGPAAVEAALTGAVAGHFDNPTKGPQYTCGNPTFPDLFTLNDVEGSVGGTTYSLQITINNFTPAGAQNGSTTAFTLTQGTDTAHNFITVHSPTVVMTDRQSGTFEGDLQHDLLFDAGAPTVHIKGSFHC